MHTNIKQNFRKVGTLFLALFLLASPAIIQAATVKELETKQKAAEARAKEAAAEAAKQKDLAAKAAQKVQQVSGQIKELEQNLVETQKTIATTQKEIEEKNQTVAEMESRLRGLQDQQDAVVQLLYIDYLSKPRELQAFSPKSISEREEREAQFMVLRKSVAILYSQTQESKRLVEDRRAELNNKSQDLSYLQAQQGEQKKGLAIYRSDQQDLQQDAIGAAQRLEREAATARQEAAKYENQVQALLDAAISNSSKGLIGKGPGVGTRISAGTPVGNVGCTGFCTGPHLHLEVRVGGAARDPQIYLNNGTISLPLRGTIRITQGFGYTEFAKSGAYKGGQHTGIDYGAAYGTTLYAPADGTVILNETISGYGRAWAVQLDNGIVVLYGHMIAQ